ncbi:MAG: 3-phosphoshikimate 1-carboxyvinyltransferase, partial [Candidatus Helarchaeota archaeon]
ADDTIHSLNAIRALGVAVQEEKNRIRIGGTNGHFIPCLKELNVGNSGTTMRFTTGVASLIEAGELIIRGTPRMHERPMEDLIKSLNELGACVVSLEKKGFPPIKILGGGIKGGKTALKGNVSSQYFSALLLAGIKAKNQVEIKTIGELKSKPYIDLTIDVLENFGATIENQEYDKFIIPPTQEIQGKTLQVEGDYSSASYFLALAAVLPSKIRITNLKKNSKQGDARIVEILEKMGSKIKWGLNHVEVIGHSLKAITIDMKDIPDLVPTIAVLGAFAEGETQITNVGHLRFKESDRLNAIATELKKMGAHVTELEDGLKIARGTIKETEIETYDDHRITMSFAIAALKTGKIRIKNPKSVAKSFPEFFQVIQQIADN